MTSSNAWSAIHGEREALVGQLASLTEEQWATPSLCADWTVRDVLGHMTATAEMTPPKFFAKMIGAGFNFNKMTAKDVAAHVQGSSTDTLARFKGQLKATTHPPGPIDAMVGEAVIHGEDIRRPLAISHTYSTQDLRTVADFYKGSNLIVGAKKRIAGLALKATDAEWSTGAGPQVSGPMLSLILAMTGRKAGLDSLSGEGVATLTGRM